MVNNVIVGTIFYEMNQQNFIHNQSFSTVMEAMDTYSSDNNNRRNQNYLSLTPEEQQLYRLSRTCNLGNQFNDRMSSVKSDWNSSVSALDPTEIGRELTNEDRTSGIIEELPFNIDKDGVGNNQATEALATHKHQLT